MMRAVSASRCMAWLAGMTMLRDSGVHVAYPGRIIHYHDWGLLMRDDHWSIVASEARSEGQEQVCRLARDVSHGLLTSSHYVRSPLRVPIPNQNTERGDHGLTSAGSRSASEPDRVAGSVAKNQPTSRFSLNLFSLAPVERAAHEHLVSNACFLSDVVVDSTIYNTIPIPISIPIY